MATESLKFPPEKLCKCFEYHPFEPKPMPKSRFTPASYKAGSRQTLCEDVPKGYKSFQSVEITHPGKGETMPFRTALDHSDEPENDFDHYSAAATPIKMHHIIMNRIGERIRDKPNWWVKIEDDALWKKWMDEAASAPAFSTFNKVGGFNAKARTAIREELRWLAKQRDNDGFDLALDYTVKSDNLIPSEIKQELLAGVAKLEDVPEEQKDWHPGSKNRVLDLVHPSLYPVMYGVTRITDKPIEFDPETVIRQHALKGEILKPQVPDVITVRDDQRGALTFPEDDEVDKVIKEWYFREQKENGERKDEEMEDTQEGQNDQDEGVQGSDMSLSSVSTPTDFGNEDEENQNEEDEEGQGENDEEEPAAGSDTSSVSAQMAPNEAQDRRSYEDVVYSKRFCWLPTDFHIDKENGKVTPAGYINNLHPRRHARLYSTLSKILEKCVPLFNEVLTQSISPPRDRCQQSTFNLWKGVTLEEFKACPGELRQNDDYRNDEQILREINSYIRYQNRNLSEEEKRAAAEKDVCRIFVLPPALDFKPPLISKYSKVNLTNHHRMQVIVKLANIVLTPEQPKYNGGSWHVEGAMNERIVATAIYYYDCENVTENELSFRKKCEIPAYEQSDDRGVELAYGLQSGESDGTGLVQNLGSIVTKEDRVIAFPNTFQHRVSPLKLIDPKKPGHRKILCFFLIDPFYPIPSTSNIGPQQGEWWEEEINYVQHFSERLPAEIFQEIFSQIKEPLTMDEAKAVRLELMEERSVGQQAVNQNHLRDFTLCEH